MNINPESFFNDILQNIVTPLYELTFGVALAYFMYGVFMFIYNKDKEEEIKKGKQHLLYGTIGLFIIASIGAIFNVLEKLLNITL